MNPKPATPPFTLPPIFSAVRNGMKIYVVPRAGLPLVSLHLIFPYGAEADPPGKAGLTDLAAEMLTLGTRRRSAAQIASEVDGLGASLSARAGWDATGLHLQGLKEDLDRLLELLREMVAEASFPEEEFAQLQQRRVATLVQQKDESQIVAGERFEEILFRGTPYDHPVYGTLKTIPLISRDEVQAFYGLGPLPEGSFWVLAEIWIRTTVSAAWRRISRLWAPPSSLGYTFQAGPAARDQNFSHRSSGSDPKPDSSRPVGDPSRSPGSLPVRGDELHPGRGRLLLPADAADPRGDGIDLRNPQFPGPAPASGPFCGGHFYAYGNYFRMRGGKFIGYEIISSSRRDKNGTGRSRSIFEGKLSPEIRDPGPDGAKDSANGDIWTGNRFPAGLPSKKSRIPGKQIFCVARGCTSIPKTW